MTQVALDRAGATTGTAVADLERQLEDYRTELTGYATGCSAPPFEAEDAVQETLVRAWKSLDRFEGRAALRSWLYRIATNVCLDMLNGRKRRARPMDMGPASVAEATLGAAARRGAVGRADPRFGGGSGRRRSGRGRRSRASRSAWRSSPRSSTCRRSSAPS